MKFHSGPGRPDNFLDWVNLTRGSKNYIYFPKNSSFSILSFLFGGASQFIWDWKTPHWVNLTRSSKSYIHFPKKWIFSKLFSFLEVQACLVENWEFPNWVNLTRSCKRLMVLFSKLPAAIFELDDHFFCSVQQTKTGNLEKYFFLFVYSHRCI